METEALSESRNKQPQEVVVLMYSLEIVQFTARSINYFALIKLSIK